jgi:hypothetical protein
MSRTHEPDADAYPLRDQAQEVDCLIEQAQRTAKGSERRRQIAAEIEKRAAALGEALRLIQGLAGLAQAGG